MAALAGCQPAPADNVQQSITAKETSPLPKLRVAEPPMDRAALLLAAATAASATGLGRGDTDEQRRLDGKAFETRIRFGCQATDPQANKDASPFTVRFDPKARTLRIRAEPDLMLENLSAEALAGQPFEAVEGFWIRRPWLLSDGCPAGSPAAKRTVPTLKGAPVPRDDPADALPAPVGRQVGLAQFFTEADSRTGRRAERAYEATKTLTEHEQPSQQGYNLVLSGRLRKVPTGRVIACHVRSSDEGPDCIVSVQFDRVWIEDPETKQILAEWSS